MQINENTNSILTIVNSTEIGGEIDIADNETNEVGTVISHTSDGELIVQWQNADESETHEEFELISIYSPNVTIVKVEKKPNKIQFKQNPFGLFGKKKKFDIDFRTGVGEQEEYHSATVTARNKTAAVKKARNIYKREKFTLDSIEELD